jgi:hypothetical protein
MPGKENTDKSIIMKIQSLYNKTWTTWQLEEKCGVLEDHL